MTRTGHVDERLCSTCHRKARDRQGCDLARHQIVDDAPPETADVEWVLQHHPHEVERRVANARTARRHLGGVAKVGLAQLHEVPARGHDRKARIDGATGEAVEDEIDAPASGVRADLQGEVETSRVHDQRHAELAQMAPFLLGACRCKDLGAGSSCQLDRCQPYPARGRVDQHPLPRTKIGQPPQRVIGGEKDDRHAGRRGRVQPGRQGRQKRRRCHHLLREPGEHHPEDRLAYPQRGHVATHLDHGAGDLEPRGLVRRALGQPTEGLHHIPKVQAGRVDPDPHLARAQAGHLHGSRLDAAQNARLADDDPPRRPHACRLRRRRLRCRCLAPGPAQARLDMARQPLDGPVVVDDAGRQLDTQAVAQPLSDIDPEQRIDAQPIERGVVRNTVSRDPEAAGDRGAHRLEHVGSGGRLDRRHRGRFRHSERHGRDRHRRFRSHRRGRDGAPGILRQLRDGRMIVEEAGPQRAAQSLAEPCRKLGRQDGIHTELGEGPRVVDLGGRGPERLRHHPANDLARRAGGGRAGRGHRRRRSWLRRRADLDPVHSRPCCGHRLLGGDDALLLSVHEDPLEPRSQHASPSGHVEQRPVAGPLVDRGPPAIQKAEGQREIVMGPRQLVQDERASGPKPCNEMIQGAGEPARRVDGVGGEDDVERAHTPRWSPGRPRDRSARSASTACRQRSAAVPG